MPLAPANGDREVGSCESPVCPALRDRAASLHSVVKPRPDTPELPGTVRGRGWRAPGIETQRAQIVARVREA